MSDTRPRSITLRGFNEHAELVRVEDDLPPAQGVAQPPAARSFPEVEYVDETGGPELLRGQWSAFMIWTQRRIYCVDPALACRVVMDRASFMPIANHPVVGCRLAFGQVRDASGAIVRVSRPLPEIGSNAVFSAEVGQRVRWSETSPVARVVLRLHRVTINPASGDG